MKTKKLNSLLLSGLIVGPVLGSGIIILPPAIYEIAGSWSFLAWILMICVSFLFAYIFGFLSIKFPGDAGVSDAVKFTFGEEFKRLTSFYLIGAVCFGPVAVLITAGRYISYINPNIDPFFAGFIILIFNLLILTREISFIGKAAFILSSISAVTLFTGGISTLVYSRKEVMVLSEFDPSAFGYSLLLLFWTIVGWEIMGNYSRDVEKPEKTIKKAVIISAIVIAAVSIAVSASIQWLDPSIVGDKKLSVSLLLFTMFGSKGEYFMSFLVIALCITTFLLFVGGVARLINSLSKDKIFPHFLSIRLKNGSPVAALLMLGLIHGIFLTSSYYGFYDVKSLIALADGFFISNALLGILAAYKLIENSILKLLTGVLAIFFVIILSFSSKTVLTVLFAMAVIVNRRRLPYIKGLLKNAT
ncbi:MAG: amino acid permease [Desulfobacterales bacterium]|nr:amino acid permease [Desulfobacterales bacterium]MCP4163184.1 amino acid permease [Deltaproteobacteria bacterium]